MNIKHIIKISILTTFQQPQVTGKACSGFFDTVSLYSTEKSQSQSRFNGKYLFKVQG